MQKLLSIFVYLILLIFLESAAEVTGVPASAPAELPEEPSYVALTFDDGPRRGTTARLLDGLRERGASATFFLVGSRLADDPEGQAIVRRMAAEGHQVGVHTFDHVMLTDLSRRDYDVQVGRTRALLAQIAGPGDYWLRPPYGITDQAAEQWAASPLILWSVDPEDWKLRSAQKVTALVLRQTKPGDIILLHDIYATSVEAALQIVDALTEQGYWFVTVEELLELNGIRPQAGVLYRSGRG